MTTHIYTVAHSADDAQQAGTAMSLNGNTIAITAVTRYGGFAFDTSASPIAQAKTVASAVWTWFTAGTVSDPNFLIKGHKVTNSAQFTTTASDISDRWTGAPTAASVVEAATGLAGGTRRDVDVTAIVQELVLQAGWANNSRLTILVKGEDATNAQIRAFDFADPALYSFLTVVTVDATTVPVFANHYRKFR